MIKHDFLKIWEKLQILEALKTKNLNAKFLIENALFFTPFKGTENALFFTPFKGTENRFSISCMV